MHSNPQRLAWTVLTTAFILFCVLVVSVPLLSYNYVRNSQVQQFVVLQVSAGTVSVVRPGRLLAEVIELGLEGVPEGARIETDGDSEAVLTFFDPRLGESIGTVQVYGGTAFQLGQIRSPRFSYSPHPHLIGLNLGSGRVRVSLEPARPSAVSLETPQGMVSLLQAGNYAIEVSERETQVTVRQGQAIAAANGGETLVEANQRTVIPTGAQPLTALPPERSLLGGGPLVETLGTLWTITQRQADPGDDPGAIQVNGELGRPALRFLREGGNWGLLEVRQELNRDVRDLRELRLHVAVLILRQDLDKCGSLGSECPVMVRIEFVDTSGNPQEWLQGFYSAAASAGAAPSVCLPCPPPTGPHIRVQPQSWYIYDSPNLIEEMNRQELAPAYIRSISVYASGHLFESMVSELDLLALE
jgi:hypothetical protein